MARKIGVVCLTLFFFILMLACGGSGGGGGGDNEPTMAELLVGSWEQGDYSTGSPDYRIRTYSADSSGERRHTNGTAYTFTWELNGNELKETYQDGTIHYTYITLPYEGDSNKMLRKANNDSWWSIYIRQ